MILRRRILVAAGRRVHLWCGGRGPAVVLLHGSPGNAELVTPLAERLAGSFSVYAVDTPGFGGSDALPGPLGSVADIADAYVHILEALGLADILIYGTHSGAAIGLELAHRHPSRVCGFVLEGVPAFSAEEMRPLLAPEYMQSFEPEMLGGHYSRTWTRFHDQFVWFPWYRRDPLHLNEAAAGSARDIHLWVEMYFQAAQHDYRPVYRTVIGYGAAAIEAARAVRVPGVYMAERSDMLFEHLDRLPPLAAGQRIERLAGPVEVPARVESALRSLPPSACTGGAEQAQAAHEYFHDLPGGQMLVRSQADRAGTPVLLLHDAPGAGRQLLELYEALSARRPVLLPDLPGCGESDPLESESLESGPLDGGLSDPAARLGDYADALAGFLSAYRRGPVHVHGVGIGAALALELNARHPELVRGLSLTGLLRTSPASRRAMIGRLAPVIALEDDGSHWYRTWLMLRDSLVRWPWYDRSPSALRRQAPALEPDSLHAWTCDVMRQWASYHRIIDAALGWDPAAPISNAGGKLTIALDPWHALHASDLDWVHSGVDCLEMPVDLGERAQLISARAGDD